MSDQYSYLSNADSGYVESIYREYLADPESVDYGWRKFFEGFDFAKANYTLDETPEAVLKEIRVLNLINAYRTRGHLFTRTNPVRDRRKYSPTLDLKNFDLGEEDLDTIFQSGTEVGLGPVSLREIITLLEETYCDSIGVEYMYMREPELVEWLQTRMENIRNHPKFELEDKRHILHKLNQAVVFESFLGTKYVGQKRFSLEGAETLIPAMDALIERGSDLGIEEFVLGMAHRGRLNVLANILNKTYDAIFSEFEGFVENDGNFHGDVKYHMGFTTDVKTEKGKTVHLSLCPNPSHLESVDPVAQGKARAKLDIKHDGDEKKIAPILIHGDASVAGQGIVYEVMQMSETQAYRVGGTLHIVINNQVGFTTNYSEARSSTYCTDVAKVTLSPVFHVNGDDAEAVVYACQLAMEFRQQFHKDVFIDLLCYRRHGHNEGDEPRFTQPELYKIIDKHPNPREIYFKKLLESGEVEANLAKQMTKEFKKLLQERLDEVKEKAKSVEYSFEHSGWKDLRYKNADDFIESPDTSVPEKVLRPLAEKMSHIPDDLAVYPKARKIYEARLKMLNETGKLNWALGELMAYASLLNEGHRIRISGQDVERGTFAHRHAILKVGTNEEDYTPLNKLNGEQPPYEIYNSILSEFGVLGFEFGYSWSAPYSLVIWEAQFGDFVNGAQTIIDQYISSAETKWRRTSGLVMLLPHGFEGMGPEHSSARMERFLELCAGNNMQVCNPTTPASIFHLLRRQLHRDFRVPLIIFSPKSLLGNPKATSTIDEFTSQGFKEVLDDPTAKVTSVKRLLFCSGKIYYDLEAYKEQNKVSEVAVIRLEQLYPLPEKQLDAILSKYKNAKEYYWVQEEPENMGPWPYILRKWRSISLKEVTRPENSSPATGYAKQHKAEQEKNCCGCICRDKKNYPEKKRIGNQ